MTARGVGPRRGRRSRVASTRHRGLSTDATDRNTDALLAGEVLVANERRKLFANALNTLATLTAGLGIAAPLAGAFWKTLPTNLAFTATEVVVGCAIWLFVVAALHCAGSYVLGFLKVQ